MIAASSALTGATIPHVHAGEDNTIRLALIGCGGRGSGAVADACTATGGPVKLVAMADLFRDRLEGSHVALGKQCEGKIDVPPERRFVGFDAYQKAIDCLRPGDIAILGGYAAWRPQQLEYAVAKDVNAFMEKSFGTDPPALRRIIAAGEAAEKKNLKIASGLMCRHSPNRQELITRIRNGELGDILLVRACRMQPIGALPPRPDNQKELDWQIRNFTSFYWVSGGWWAEMDIHQIDEICWIKDAYPATAHGVCGRAVNSADCGQSLDSFSAEWTFADGTMASDVVRYIPNCYNDFATYVYGTKCAAQFSGNIHASTVQIFKDQRIAKDNVAWKAPKEKSGLADLYVAEWEALLGAIRNNRPHNEAKRAAQSNMADMMGRAAMHMGKVVTWNEVMASNFQWCPNIDSINEDSEPPVKADAQGRYPAPVPGAWTEL